MKAFLRDTLRILTGRIAYERRARMLALELGQQEAERMRREGYVGHDTMDSVARFYLFLLSGEVC